jgi:hypothetical protein
VKMTVVDMIRMSGGASCSNSDADHQPQHQHSQVGRVPCPARLETVIQVGLAQQLAGASGPKTRPLLGWHEGKEKGGGPGRRLSEAQFSSWPKKRIEKLFLFFRCLYIKQTEFEF